ncbi:MAG: gliding motility-associated C-terminal domain-containing protein [Prevotellaceae bacterium]|jgi:gliding motility-associated-like protein|nr:gliding motility-associated C-terminal domain-containing protein [Prevotellaceae bacterium]
MKNILKYMTHYFVIKLFSAFIFITSASGLLNAQNQQIININNESGFQNLIKQENHPSLINMFPNKVEKFRLFEYNPQLKTFTSKNQGDILLLDFFENKKYKAVVQKVTIGYDGIIGITAKILDTDFGYCYISISEKGISVSVDIPQYDEQFFVVTKNGKSYLSLCKMSEMKKSELGCTDIDLPESENSEHTHAHTETDEIIAADASDCTFPPDALSDSLTVNVLVVYTANAEQYALNYDTDIHNVIDQAMQRANIAMVNSLTNITFTLAYKHKTSYTEVNSSTDLERLTYTNDGYMDEVHDLRKQYKADLVMLIPEVDFTGGLAWILNYYIPGDGRPVYGFGLSRVQQTSWTYTMVHEMGHNMGCGHHWQQNSGPGPGLFSYSSGYRGQDISSNWYSTIMTYEGGSYFIDGNYAPRIPFFADPDIIHNGVNIGDVTYANNALTLRQSKHAVSRYSDYFVPGLKCLSVSEGTLSPVFHTDTTTYTVIVSSSVSSIIVYATPSHPSSTILTGTGTHSLSCGLNSITVTVKTPTNEMKSYTINVIRTCGVTVFPSDTTICAGGSATLRAIGESGAIFKWYDSQTGGTLLNTGDSYTVSPLSTTNYYVSQTVSGAESSRTQTTVTVIPSLSSPAANDVTACYDGATHTASATAGTDETVVWYTAASGGTLTSEPSRSAVGTTTAYAASRNNITSCESSVRTAVSVTIYSLPNAPTANDVTACYDGTTHTASATTGTDETVVWYTAASGGTLTSEPSRSAVGTTTVYAASRNNITNCESSARTAVSVTIYALPNAPAANDVTACYDGATHTASATTGTDETVVWYTAASGGTLTSEPSRSAVGTTTAYAASRNNITNCESSARTAVSVTIYALPNAPAANDVTACYDGTTHTASATTGTDETVVWYTAASGGTLTSEPRRSTVGTTTAYAASRNNITNCESPVRTAVSVTIYSLPNAPAANDITACYDGTTYTASATAGTDETVVWYTAASGGTLTSEPSRSAVGTTTAYAASRNNITNCESSVRTAVSVTINPVYNINVDETICTGESYSFNGNSYTATGIYTVNLLSSSGCDSIVTLNLIVLQSCNPQFINVDADYYNLTYGDNSFNFTATATSGLPLSFDVSGTSVDIQIISAGQYSVTVQSIGTTVVTLQQAGDNYFASVELSVTIEVHPAELSIKAKNYTVNVGDAFPILKCEYSGFVYDEDSTVLKKLPAILCAAVNTNIAGEYPIIVSGAEADNYVIKYVDGILKIKGTKRQLPNAFTPYNKDAINDTFGEGYELYIFNRWGVCIYKDTTGKGWDGKYKGKILPPGAYYYYAKDSNGNTYKGSVMLIKNH